MKPLILIFPFNLLSHYLRCMVLAKRFLNEYEIRIAHSDEYASFIAAEGFDTFHSRHFNAPEVMKKVAKFDFSWLEEASLQRIFETQVDIICKLQPVAVVGDSSPTLKMAAEKTGVKYIALTNGYLSKYYAGTRNLSRSHFAFSILKQFPPVVAAELMRQGEALSFKTIHKPFVKMRSRNNLTATASYSDELEGDLNLICDLPDIFPQKKLPDHYKIIGPLLTITHKMQMEESQLQPNRKTIFVSMGSSGDWNKVLFLNDRRFSRYNIVTAGDKEKRVEAPNVSAFDFLPLDAILPKADVVICHGGNGTIYHTLSYGVPLFCLPSHFEQEWNVDAIEKLGLGTDITNFNVDDVLDLIEKSAKTKLQLSSHALVKKLQEMNHEDLHELQIFKNHVVL